MHLRHTVRHARDWGYRFWSDDYIAQWLQGEAEGDYQKAFLRGKSKWKADLFRCVLLARHGGLWLDSDIILLRPLSEVLGRHHADFYGLVGPFGARPGASQLHIGFMAAKTPEPVLKQWLDVGRPEAIAHPDKYACSYVWGVVCVCMFHYTD